MNGEHEGEHEVKERSYYLCSYSVRDFHLPNTYLHLPEKRNKICLFCRLHLLNFSSSDKIVCIKQEEESGSAAKNPELDPIGEPGTSGVSSTSETRKFKSKDKRKITFQVDIFEIINYLLHAL